MAEQVAAAVKEAAAEKEAAKTAPPEMRLTRSRSFGSLTLARSNSFVKNLKRGLSFERKRAPQTQRTAPHPASPTAR